MKDTEISKEEIERRNREEMVWWNKYAKTMAWQWEMTPALNKILRTDWINDFFNYLYVKDGLILDVGCGNGWISKYFAERGMNAVGADFSASQIETAKASVENRDKLTASIDFFCLNVVEMDHNAYESKFDAIIVNALLHHLTKPERAMLFQNLKTMLKPKGKIYFYEPVVFEDQRKSAVVYTFFFMLVVNTLRQFYRGWRILGFQSDFFKEQKRLGYQGTSPHEASFSYSEFIDAYDDKLYHVNITPLHAFSLQWGTFQMSLKKIPRLLCFFFTGFISGLEKLMLKNSGWKAATNKKWIMSGIKIQQQ